MKRKDDILKAPIHADLHIHTTASDGTQTPSGVVEAAVAAGLTVIAITDHDTLDGIVEAQAAAAGHNLLVIPGVELSVDYGQSEVHVLGYGVSADSEVLLSRLAYFQQSRRERLVKMVERLNRMGIGVRLDDVLAEAEGSVPGRPHLARVLVRMGVVGSIGEAFTRFIGRGGPAYVPRVKFTPREAVELVVAAGGVAVLAHPGLIGDDSLILQLLPYGLHGLEVYHPDHGPAEEERYLSFCRQYNLLATGGSDFHGFDHDEHNVIGARQAPAETVTELVRML